MDLFHILSRGAQFNKRKFGKDVARFATSSAPNAPSDAPEQPDSLPSDLDFFKYASRAGPSKQQSKQPESSDEPQQKRRKTEPGTPHAKHRIVAKGRDVPAQLDSFQAMCDTYHFSKRLVANLEEHGFHSPMSIQAQGCPVLLSVRAPHEILLATDLGKDRDLYAVSPTGTGKTLSYMLPIFAKLVAPVASGNDRLGSATGPRALIIVPTNELAQQIYNEGLKLATGRKWKVVLFSKATASTLADKAARSKTGGLASFLPRRS
jgi:ATP-dependent RNA helicase DDX52/ROK1